ncbi:hypothetical protein K445DRAFT_20740 [Daldinia sp. EC12]|nr:hypothetical protein F4774DRAFT_418867 [Daldinia eschscholtzii]OTB17392.1 hypothetical protein K445DRAFT_20740 [Daldinia sp. EC12]
MTSENDSLPVVRYRKGLSAEEFDEFIKASSKRVQDDVDYAFSLARSKDLQREASSYHWRAHWKFMLHIFKCSPWDLTTWGLRLHTGYTDKVVRELNVILPHPIWEGNVDILRYVLQKMVLFGLKTDLEPLGPLMPGIADVLIANEKKCTPGLALEMWKGTNPTTNSNIDALLKVLLKRVGKFEQQPWSPRPFLLTPQDVCCIRDALDILSCDYLAPFTVQEYYDAFVKQEMWPPGLAAVDIKTIQRWDSAMLAIKNRDERLKEPDTRVGEERKRHKILAYWKSSNCNVELGQLISENTAPYPFYP